MKIADRRSFIAYFSSIGLSSSLMPGVLWARIQDSKPEKITIPMLKEAAAIAGLDLTDSEYEAMRDGVNQNVGTAGKLRMFKLDEALAPPLYFNPIVPGLKIDRAKRPPRMAKPTAVERPRDLEQLGYWALTDLAQLVRTRQVKSVELTGVYLARLKKYNSKLNCVVTFLDDLAMTQARQADSEIAAGKYRGPLHGIPWGCKDILAVPGYPTTWGTQPYKDRVINLEATVPRLIREAGGVLVAKLSTGELANGDEWFGGRTNNPWDLNEGSSGSSAGPASATAAGLVGFAIGTETSGSILSPATRCGAVGLRPTCGRVSRYGVMALAWNVDRVGPFCRRVEDIAAVMNVICQTDERDLSVLDIPFNWDAALDVRRLRVGYLEDAFTDSQTRKDVNANDRQALDAIRGLGIKPEPFRLTDSLIEIAKIFEAGFPLGSPYATEAGAFFDELFRSPENWRQVKNVSRRRNVPPSRFAPAVEYLQMQRLRQLAMQQFAETVSSFDVYIAPFRQRGPSVPAGTTTPSTTTDYHFQLANLCGYPSIAVPNGFTTGGQPTSITFLSRPFNEAAVLALAKAYQDATQWHSKHPPAFA